ncbi:unnamed protein product [Schistosoma curassoni]|nr:unnamed protein product [Schistosoma curassoni]
MHTSPYLTDSRLRRQGPLKNGANTSKTFHKKAVRDRPQAVVPWALRSRSQVVKTNTNPISFSDSSRNTLLRCGQPGSDISPHTRNSTRDQVGHIQIPPTSPNTSLISMTNPPHVSLSSRTARANDSSTWNAITGLLKPRSKLHVGAFNVRTLCQIGQHASLAKTLESRAIDVCCVSETRIQDPSSVIHLTSPCQNKEPTRFTLRVSGSPDSASRGLAGVGIALSPRAELALLDWIPVDSRLCAVRLNRTVRIRKDRDTRRCLFVVSAYSPTDCSSDGVKDEFYRKLSDLLRKAKRSDVVIVAGDFNAQVGKLSAGERHLGGSYGVVAQRTDNGDRLLQLCSDNRLFLANTNFKHKEKHLLTWRPPNSSQRWTQIDHIAISHRWRGSIEDCRSFWSTCLDSDHALVRARICLRLTGRRKDPARKPLRALLNDSQAKSIFQEQLGKQLGSHVCDAHPDAAWNDIRKAVETAVISASKVNQKVREQH